MEINNIIKQFEDIKKINNQNLLLYTLVSKYIDLYNCEINGETIKKFKKELSFSIPNEQCFKILLEDVFNSIKPNNRKIIQKYVNENVKKVEPKKYFNNSYYLNIKPKEIKYKNWQLCYMQYNPYECFICGDTKIENDYYTFPSVSYFDKQFNYLAVLEKNVEWMAVKPNEIETMKEPISHAHGVVLTLGLGLGYFAYMISSKEEVARIDIVEKDPDVIELFKENILPYFNFKDKINIICADAYDYLKHFDENQYNYIFADIWRNANDGLFAYLQLKKIFKKINNVQIEYWVEEEIIIYLRFILINVLTEIINEEDVLAIKSDDGKIDELYRRLYDSISKMNIDDLYFFLSVENLKAIAADL